MSVVAFEPLLGRWMLHETGAREDEACKQVFISLPGISPLALQMMMGPSFLAVRLTDITPSFLTYPAVRPSTLTAMVTHRTEFFDKAVLDHLDKVKQVVIVGAGWDTRAYNVMKEAGVQVFEVDTVEMQRIKREAIQKAGIDTAHVTLVTADFNKESWLNSLKRHDFDPDLPTFFLWEEVIHYLEADAVDATVDAVSSQCAGGSAIAFDYLSRETVEGTGSFVFSLTVKYLQAVGEPWLSGISTDSPAREQVANLLEAHGLRLERYEPFGEESANEKPFGGLVVAVSAST